MSIENKDTEIKKINILTTYGDDGAIKVSIKNGYPRFTFFNRNELGRYISAPMDLISFGMVARYLEMVALSNEDVKYELLCHNKDYTTGDTILQSVLVLARRGDDVLIAIKKEADSSPNLTKVVPSKWISIKKNGESISNRELIRDRAIAMSRIMYSAAAEYELIKDGGMPNSKRENRSTPPNSTPTGSTTGISSEL